MKFTPSEIFHSKTAFVKSLQLAIGERKTILLTDENVTELWLADLLPNLPRASEVEVIEIEAGESSKSLSICSHIWSHLLECNAGRDAVLLNFGGGVVSDIGGFAASCYKRGIGYLNIPTTLLAMVDAANGGKTGIDHEGIKNVIGTYASPEATLILPEFLETLSTQELKSGFAEMLKHALISGSGHWRELLETDTDDWVEIAVHIEKSARIKEAIVRNDFFESGERKLLNLGHTIGHAIESGFLRKSAPVTHGEAIALGIMVETLIAVRMNLADEKTGSEIIQGISRFFNPSDYSPPSFTEISEFLSNDKKNVQGQIKMSLPEKIGSVLVNVTADPQLIEQVYTSFFEK